MSTGTSAERLLASDVRAGGGSVARPASWLVGLSMVLAVIVTGTSLLGLFAPWVYASELPSWKVQAQGQDLGNLLAVIALVAGVFAAARGSLRGFQVWLGSLLYLAYAFVLYSMTVHFGALFLPYVAALGLSAYCALFAVAGERRRPSVGVGARRFGAWAIGAIALLFGLLWLGSIVPALLAGLAPPELVETGLVANPVHVLDLALVLPGMLITARQALRGTADGELLLAPWLVFAALMGASIVAAMLLAQGPVAPLAFVALVTVVSTAAAWVVLRATSQAGCPEPNAP